MRHTTAPLLELRGISVRFGFVDALKDVDLTLVDQEVVAVVGDNGAGKSTLVQVIAGLLQPDGGSILMHGEPVRLADAHEAGRHGIASLFQDQEFCDNLNVAANLFLGQEIRQWHGIRDDASMTVRARDMLESLTASVRVGQSIRSLSGGQRRTVALARTMLHDPQLIVLDEPTASLCLMQTADVLSYVKRLRSEGRCVLMVCHDLPDVFAVADRIVVLRQGRIIADRRTEDTSYERVIAQIAGVDADTDIAASGGLEAFPHSATRMRHHLISRSECAAAAGHVS